MIVAGLQTDIAWEEAEANLRNADAMIGQAASIGARLIVLPEMFATGFTMNAGLACSQADRTRGSVSEIAVRHDVWVVYGLAEAGDGRSRNVALVVNPSGATVARYEKIHPFTLADEHKVYEGGSALTTTVVEGVRITPLVCYDLRFPEPFRIAADDTDLFVVIANWPRPRRVAWQTLLRARAMENQAFVMGVNRVGEGDGLVYMGDSALVDPMGELVSTASTQAGVVVGDVTHETVAATRERYTFLSDRRPHVYETLSDTRRQPGAAQSPTP